MRKISQSEKSEILKKHNDFKRILEEKSENLKRGLVVEQNQPQRFNTGIPTDPLLSAAEKAGCVSGGQQMTFTDGRPAYAKIATKDDPKGRFKTGDRIYLFNNYKMYTYPQDGSPKSEYPWTCSSINKFIDQQAASQKQAASAAEKSEIDKLKTEYSWKERSELPVPDEDINNPKLYQKHPKYNLWRSVTNAEISGTLTDRQKAFQDEWENKGWKMNLTDEELAHGLYSKYRTIVPGSEKLFSGGLQMYAPVSSVKGGTSVATAGQEIESQTVDKKDCEGAIEKYFRAATANFTLSSAEFQTLKNKVQACKDQHRDGKWSSLGIFDGGKKLNLYLSILDGSYSGTDPNYAKLVLPRKSPWRLN
jgi:hypothetical protein